MEYDAIEFASYAEYTTTYTFGQCFDEIIEKLETDMSNIVNGFSIMVLTPIQQNFNSY